MLEPLVGNQTVQRILLFLFVNGKCYGSQLHRILSTPLTPIQKGLSRLEKGGILCSFFEGKTRVYQFSPAYPMLVELEQLLKKAYTLLPIDEKRRYAYVKEEKYLNPLKFREREGRLLAFWERLKEVSEVVMRARTKVKRGWDATGKGQVTVESSKNTQIIFRERGTWHGETGEEVEFHNTFLWTLDRGNCLISLETLRRGKDQSIFLFHLTPKDSGGLSSIDSDLFEGDSYFGNASFDEHSLRLSWRVIGPTKNEELDYYYS